MRVLITTTQVPFVRGGAEIHAEGLRDALVTHGHQAEIVAIPFKWYPPERIIDGIMACRLLDITESCGNAVDRVIGLKFPAYLIPHPHKVFWILHQYRTAYELWGTAMCDLMPWPNGLQVRDTIRQADRCCFDGEQRIYANSANVASRLKTFCDVDATPLYHPPAHAEKFYSSEPEPFIFYPSRLCSLKRQWLILEALALTKKPVIWFAGLADEPGYFDELQRMATKLGVQDRVKWLGFISDEEKRDYYARCLGVVFPPVDEDYGYITLEAMLSSKPVVTVKDSGGPLEFVVDRENGLIADPTPEALADALTQLWEEKQRAVSWGKAGREHLDNLGITWTNVVETLLA